MTLYEKVIYAAEYIMNGDPYRDIIDDCDVSQLICILSRNLPLLEEILSDKGEK